MSGSRCKRLRRAFRAAHGRAVNRTIWKVTRSGVYGYVPSEWRRLKKAHRRLASRPETFFAERAVTAAHRDEVRRFHRRSARQRRRAA